MPGLMMLKFWGIAALVLLLLIMSVVAWREREEDESYMETSKRVQKKTSSVTGGILGFTGAVFAGVFGVLWQTGMSAGELMQLLASNPEVTAGLFTTVLGALGISGLIQISSWTYIGISILALGVGLIWAAQKSSSEEVSG